MATYNQLINILLYRCRQTGSVALDPDFAIELMSMVEDMVATKLNRNVSDETFVTEPYRIIYPMSALTSSNRIASMNNGTADLHNAKNLDELSAFNAGWFRETGTEFKVWSQIANSYFVVWPAKTTASSITVSASRQITRLTDFSSQSGTEISLPREDHELLLKMCEAIALLRSRDVELLKNRIKKLGEMMKHAESIINR